MWPEGRGHPLEARIVSAVDVYDALGSNRPSKQPLLEDEWQQIIRAGAGRVFDPEVVKAFFKSIQTILSLKQCRSD